MHRLHLYFLDAWELLREDLRDYRVHRGLRFRLSRRDPLGLRGIEARIVVHRPRGLRSQLLDQAPLRLIVKVSADPRKKLLNGGVRGGVVEGHATQAVACVIRTRRAGAPSAATQDIEPFMVLAGRLQTIPERYPATIRANYIFVNIYIT